MLQHLAANGAKTIIVESPDRFARDLIVQLTGHDLLKARGIALIPATAPDFFIEDTPTAVLVRQVLGAIAQFEKATLIAKLRGARERKRATGAKVEGRRTLAESAPNAVAMARELRRRQRMSMREIAAELERAGFTGPEGKQYHPGSIKVMLDGPKPV